MTRTLHLALAAVLGLGACAHAPAGLPHDHPAHPDAAAGRLWRPVDLAAYEVPVPEEAPGGSGHAEHAGHAPAAPTEETEQPAPPERPPEHRGHGTHEGH